MNKTAIKNFAVWARQKLISEITYKAGLIGISEKGILEPLPTSTGNIQLFDIGTGKPTEISNSEIKQRNAFIRRIEEKENDSDYQTAFNSVIEEVAYTWFNRLIAIRFLEVNNYLPSRIRVLSSETNGKAEPDMVTTPFDTDMEFSPYERDRVMQLKDENKLDELFRMMFIKQCNKLNEVLPELFEKTADYTELLLTISFTNRDGVVSHLVNDIEEEDFTEAVEIIGWLYQYYNTEPKADVFAKLKKNVKISKEHIGAATQLFTPDWIVRYMVENSLGRLWVEGHPNEDIKDNWKYYLNEAEQEASVKAELDKLREEYCNLTPEDIKLIDPCMGSGHILVYAFDVLMQIYESCGYTQRDAAQSILQHNLYGVDIDKRAYQLAYFAVMMKARKYDRRILNRKIKPNLVYTQDSANTNLGKSADEDLRKYLQSVENADLLGSLTDTSAWDFEKICDAVDSFDVYSTDVELRKNIDNNCKNAIRMIRIGKILSQKYDVVVTNPPYMGGKGMSPKLSKFVKKNYPDSKVDLFAVFMEICAKLTGQNRYYSMITMHSWMFLSSFEKLRTKLLGTDTVNMAHLGARAFDAIGGEVVQTTAFVQRRTDVEGYKATYKRLVDVNGEEEKRECFVANGNLYTAQKENFSKIPGSPIAYWVSERVTAAFENGEALGKKAISRNGMKTGENDRFVRQWFEIDNNKFKNNAHTYLQALESKAKWFPYNKGGEYRKWYGNNDYVVNWKDEGQEVIKHAKADKRNVQDYPLELKFSPSASWGLISSGQISFRYKEYNISDIAGMSFYTNRDDVLYYLAFCNTPIANQMLQILAPTINYQAGDIGRLPLYVVEDKYRIVNEVVQQNISISKSDWDSFETSWDFEKHPLINNTKSIEAAYSQWVVIAVNRFIQLHTNEEELNRIFIHIYGLQDELTPEVAEKDVTVARIYDTKEEIPETMKGNNYIVTKQDVVKSFVSYAVGCMFGRYSLDREGLVFAGGDFDKVFWKYKGQAALDKKGNPIAGGYAGISLADYHYPKFRDSDKWENASKLSFKPDYDNVIPITDEEYFEDDIVGLFVAFVKKVYGDETLEQNLDFIASALGNKGNTSREIIRNYFLKDFYKDHVHTYKKRPIYWLYDSGKQNGFKALIYMHRYDADTTGLVRVDYLHKMQKIYNSEIERMKDMAENSPNTREVAQAEKRKEKLIKQLKEAKEYDEKIAHLALSRIDIDLDDGVKVNYEKVQTGQDGKKLQILGKI